jgi:hypothetical protein
MVGIEEDFLRFPRDEMRRSADSDGRPVELTEFIDLGTVYSETSSEHLVSSLRLLSSTQR